MKGGKWYSLKKDLQLFITLHKYQFSALTLLHVYLNFKCKRIIWNYIWYRTFLDALLHSLNRKYDICSYLSQWEDIKSDKSIICEDKVYESV